MPDTMNYAPLIEHWLNTPELPARLQQWAQQLPDQIDAGLSHQRYGDLARWQDALAALPELTPTSIDLNSSRVGARRANALDEQEHQALHSALRALHPWRKGPFELFDVHIDTEWRSDWKWDRLAPHISPLDGKRVLDVGCGSGYHCWRMRGAGASEVIGIDPTPLFVVQFWALQKYLQQNGVWVLPLGIEHLPEKLEAFDTVFSMGILYHRRSPFDHLRELKDCLAPGGELVLETLVIDGPDGMTLVPKGRYARMGNVWFLPSVEALLGWLQKVGFKNPEVADVNTTSLQEQRSTEWMQFQSLADFLDPNDHSKTLEGYPAPKRCVVIAHK